MTYCTNPDCQNPQNPDLADFCHSCGSKLLLKNRYRIIHPVERGKDSGTFLAVDEDQPSKPLCAIKQLVTADGKNGSHADSMQLEELGQHAQIPKLLASFENEGRQYLVQEYIEGKSLERELAEQGTFNEAKIRELLGDMLPVLQFLHGLEAIHRDIKPANIIRPSKGGKLALVDLSAFQINSGLGRFKFQKAIGSAEYAAPEQTKGEAVFASDLYSLGVTCLYLLTGLSSFDLYDVKAEVWVWQDYLKRPVSKQLGRVLEKLIQRDRKLRYATAADVLKDLKFTPVQDYLPPPKTRFAAALGGAALALLSITLGHRMPSPAPQTFAEPEPLSTLPEIPYTLPEIEKLAPSGHKQVPPMRTLASTSGPVWSVAVSPDGKAIASGSTDGTIQIWKVGSGNLRVPMRTLYGHSEPIWSLAISPDGKLLASGSADKTIKVWNLSTGELLDTLKGHTAGIFSVAFSPDSQRVASGSFDKSVKLWQINTDKNWRFAGNLLYTFSGHSQEVQSVAFSPDSRTLASASTDGTIKVWNWRTGKLMRTLAGHSDSVWSVAISPDGKTLASGSWDKTIKLWNLEKGTLRRTLYGHSEQIHSVAFSPNGKTLASGDLGGTIKLWGARSGCQKGTLKGHSDWVEVAFAARGKTLVSGSFDDTIKLWRLNP